MISERTSRIGKSPTFLIRQRSYRLPQIRCLHDFRHRIGVGGHNTITFVGEFWDRALDCQFVTGNQFVDVFGGETIVVFLNKERQLSGSI